MKKGLLICFFLGLTITGFSQAGLYYRSNGAGGSWSNASNWQTNTVATGGTWIAAVAPPNSSSQTIAIRNTSPITVNSTVTADQIVVGNNATLTVATGAAFTVEDGTGNDLIVPSSGTLTMS